MAMIGAIPYIGSLITIVLLTYFLVTASVETHKVPSQKAWVVFGIIGAALFFISLGAEIATQGTREQLLEMQKQMQNK
jgi:hypothetical protein